MQKPKSKKPEIVVLKKAQPASTERNAACTCGRVYKNPEYTLQYAMCPRHGARDAVQSN